jgi:hypothetical protein
MQGQTIIPEGSLKPIHLITGIVKPTKISSGPPATVFASSAESF